MSRRSVRSAGVLAAGVALALSGVAAAPALAAPAPGHHTFSPAAASFVGADTVQQKVQRLETALAALPRLAAAYDVKPLWDKGTNGTGITVATLVSFGDKDIQSVIDSYDQRNGLPKADVQILEPVGHVPGCHDAGVDTATCQSWGGETDLDVEMIHTLAPGAKIVIAATPVAETEGITGLPEMMQAVDYMTTNKSADIISMSFGTAEDNFDSPSQVTGLDPAFQRASAAGVTLTASSGDSGATNHTKSGGYWNKRTASWPAADPNVTAVGGTNSVSGKPNTTLWPDSGGGLSSVYNRPSWQDSVSKITNSTKRSFPDITMEGTSGTSESSPLFAGVLALAAQTKGGRLGQVNTALYTGKLAGIVDVTSGNNSYNGVTGFAAGKGFDIVSGWGTIDAAKFVPSLVTALR
ncbi:S53 family peptidase [Kutzneria sp. CA-103260]|uniref:S53 family peptidase n=1 Tax=Kutzneria sp. CA-103260 TaxID=2802641 RepID=UPI001BAA592D|nr:S53 family peptidase [Kutzneria sp. CA-103260]QUQ69083.1 peptidase S8 [Kutzneria sp. CA-103260]